MMLLIAWISTALAATPGGFSHDTARDVDTWSVRNVLIYSPDIEIIDQVTPRISKTWGAYGFDAEVSLLGLTGPGGDIFGGIGSLNTGHWWVIKNEGGAHHRIGMVVGLPLVPREMEAHAFGSAFDDTLMSGMFKVGWRVGWNETEPWDIKLQLGAGQSNLVHTHGPSLSPIFEFAVVKVIPVTERSSLVMEYDIIGNFIFRTNFRPMMRWELGESGKSAVDAGLQVPLGDSDGFALTYATVQMIAQYRSNF